jgi:heme/copper-type cytochrome/quinol oxidase subunit 3
LTEQALHAGAHGGEEDKSFLHHEEASIFPVICALGASLLLGGTGANWNEFAFGNGMSILGAAILAGGMIGWWAELVQANFSEEKTLLGTPDEARRGMKWGFGFFIGSEVAFFGAFFAAYFYTRYHIWVTPGMSWPPSGYEPLPLGPALINTALLVTSGFVYMYGEKIVARDGNAKVAAAVMALALAMGVVFLGIQALEWATLMSEGFRINDGMMGTSFYLLTGFHGMHVIIGALFIAAVMVRVAKGHFTSKKHFAMTAAGWYWHFVDVVWIGLVLALYVF